MVSTVLRKARKRAGMTQRQLADLSTVSVRTIRDLELERTRVPRKDTIRLLANALRMSDAGRAELEAAAGLASGGGPDVAEFMPPPAPLNPMVGRRNDVEELTTLLETAGQRLIIVAGLAGIGKTRLMQEVACTIHASGYMPVIWVGQEEADRAPWDLAGQVAALMRGGNGLREVVDSVADRRVLLVVDGHGLGRDAPRSVRVLLRRCPQLRVLFEAPETSPFREGVIHPVFPLPTPEWRADATGADLDDYPALQFLMSRCPRLSDGRTLDRERFAALARVCWLLDGIPLFMEAAASWLALYEPTHLVDTAVRSPLAFATSLSTAASDLFASLERAVTSLGTREAEVLSRLAAIETAWTVQRAAPLLESSALDAMHQIHALCLRGLIRPVESVAGGPPRFTVLNLVRHMGIGNGSRVVRLPSYLSASPGVPVHDTPRSAWLHARARGTSSSLALEDH